MSPTWGSWCGGPVWGSLMVTSWTPGSSWLCPFPGTSSQGRRARCFQHLVFREGYPDSHPWEGAVRDQRGQLPNHGQGTGSIQKGRTCLAPLLVAQPFLPPGTSSAECHDPLGWVIHCSCVPTVWQGGHRAVGRDLLQGVGRSLPTAQCPNWPFSSAHHGCAGWALSLAEARRYK